MLQRFAQQILEVEACNEAIILRSFLSAYRATYVDICFMTCSPASTSTLCTLSTLSTVCISRVVLERKEVLRDLAPAGCQPCSFSQYAFYAIN